MLIFGLNRQIAILHVVQVRTNLHNTVRKRECRSNACIANYTISRELRRIESRGIRAKTKPMSHDV